MDVRKLIAKYETLSEIVESATEAVQLDPSDPQQLYSVALHGTLLELSKALLALLKLGDATATPILLRSMLEAYVDLSNLVSDEGYLRRMGAAWLKQRLRLAKAAQERGADNPYLASINKDPNLETVIEEIQADLEGFEQEGAGALKIHERFRHAGEQDRYDSVYAHLCSHSHNNLNALEERHIEQTPESYQVMFFRPITSAETQMYIDTMAGMIANSTAFVQRLTEQENPKGLDVIGRELEELRSLYKAG